MTVFVSEIKRSYKTMLIWSVIVGGLTMLFMMIYPSVRDQMGNISDVYANLGSFSAAFGMDKLDFGTSIGFYGIEAGAMLSICGSIYAALTGIAMLSKEENSRTAEFLLSHPLPRLLIISEKLLALLALIIGFNAIYYIFAALSFSVVGESYEIASFALFHFAQTITHIMIGLLCFGISALFKRTFTGVGIGAAMLMYFISMYANITEEVSFLKYITPFSFSDASRVFTEKVLDAIPLAVCTAYTLLIAAAGAYFYIRKDISA